MSMQSQVDLIKEKLNILDVVSAYVKLEKAGSAYKGKSPFNQEKTPSFFVHPDKGFFYDFSAGFGGDIFTFIQKIEHISFPEALKMLAEKAGVSLHYSPEAEKKASQEKRLFAILEDATIFYEKHLRARKDVLDYLKTRGLKPETITRFRLGFIPDAWRELYQFLRAKGYQDHEIEQAGLIKKKEGSGYYDRFRSRIIFPLFDERGRVVAFSGRIFQGDEKAAKYLNSPETLLFDKSKMLYAYHLAKARMTKEDYLILVEGQFDVILAHQAGYHNTVAISGTGLTTYQLQMIKRFTKNIFLALDSDRAGIKATKRSVLLAYQEEMSVKVLLLDPGKDPADIIAQSKEKWDLIVKDAKDYIDYRLELAETELSSFEERQKFVFEELFPFLSFVQKSSTREFFLKKMSDFLAVSIDALREDFMHYFYESQQGDEVFHKKEEEEKKLHKEVQFHFFDDLKKEFLLFYYFMQENFSEEMLKEESFFSVPYAFIFHKDINDALEELTEEERAMALFMFQDEGEHHFSYFLKKLKKMILDLEKMYLEREAKRLREKIKRKQREEPNILPVDLLKKNSDILKKIDSIKSQLSNL